MYYSKLSNSGSGLTNQIFALITSILCALISKHKVVVFDYFMDEILKNKYTPISEIFDIDKINIFLKTNYDIIIVDKYNARFELCDVTYGTNTDYVVLTDYILQHFYKDNKIHISKSIDFNSIYGNPIFGTPKNVFLHYKINEYDIHEVFSENIEEDIVIDVLNADYIFYWGWINDIDTNMFENILKNIHYNQEFINTSNLILNKIDMNRKINVLHLRLEDDAINYWSKINITTPDYYREIIENKYIGLIQKYINKSDINIILSHSLSNGVIDFLCQNNYNYQFNEKFYKYREKDAIIDLLVSKCCNNIFIGNFNIEKLSGSTFSYYVSKFINNKMDVYIDLDSIYDNEVIVNK